MQSTWAAQAIDAAFWEGFNGHERLNEAIMGDSLNSVSEKAFN